MLVGYIEKITAFLPGLSDFSGQNEAKFFYIANQTWKYNFLQGIR